MKKLITICALVVVVIAAAPAVANITITAADGVNYTYQRWDFDTDHTETATYPMPYLKTLVPETDHNPYGDPSVSITAYGTTASPAGWYDNLNGQDVMHAGPLKMLIVSLTIPNKPNPDLLKIVQVEFAYKNQYAGVPITAYVTDPLGAVLVSEVKGIDSLGWDEMTYTWHIYPQPPSETIMFVFMGGATNGADLNYVEVATVCTPEPVTFALLGLGGLFLRRRK